MQSLRSSYKKHFSIPSEFTDQVENKNRRVLTVLSLVGLFFGAALLLFEFILFLLKQPVRPYAFIYYASFLFMGVFGFLLTKLKLKTAFIMVYLFFCLEYIFFFFLYGSTLMASLLVFLGLSFVFIMFLEINPLILTAFILFTLIFMTLYKTHPFFINNPHYKKSIILLGNIYLIFFTMIFLVFWKRKRIVEEFRHELELKHENEKEEKVLKNIFPEKIIEKMKESEYTAAEAYDSVTVLHTDIVNFTKTSSSLEPEFVISELNEIFTAFDEITEKHGCIRIKTIGDAYVAVCGLPEINSLHSENMVKCAQEFIAYLEERNKTSSMQWNIRIGLASGSVVAGVVGISKFVYDIFGSTVDKAEKLEAKGLPMSITVSKETYGLLSQDFLSAQDMSHIRKEDE